MNTETTVRTGAFSTRRMMTRSMRTPRRTSRQRATNATQYGSPAWISAQAM